MSSDSHGKRSLNEVTKELNDANEELVFQNEEKEKRAAELLIVSKELSFLNEEKASLVSELDIADKKLVFQNAEKAARASELVIADKELAFQSDEKADRAAELIIANKELAFQNEEKEKRAAELVIANKELAFQNEEKDKRAAELIIANKELAFQNEQKEKRAAELIIANKELAFQNEEKEKRAAELIIANKELAFQNEEKENRAAELIIANKELAFQNVEKEKRANELLIERQLFEKTLISIGDGVISIDKDKNVLFMNTIAEELTGWLKNEAIGQPINKVFNIINELTRSRGEDVIGKVINSKTIRYIENHKILISKDGSEKLIENSVAPILDKDNSVVGVVVAFRDFTEKWEKLRKIEHLNFHDDLTGLYNRRFFEEELLRLDKSRNLPMSIIMGDINGLKLINDSFGHKTGDELLKMSAYAIKNACREDEIVARFGGDEFAIILPKSSAAQVEGIIDRIKCSLLSLKISGIDVSVAFGFGTKNHIEQDILTIVKEAEDYMYRNKLFESSSMHFKTIEIISNALFEKNGRELLHSERVSKLCELLALKLGFDKDHIAFIKTTGLMHDIGKIAIEDNILNKVGKLSVDEYKEIKKHPEIGYRILGSVSEFSELAIHVLQHHEKWDGSGYPKGLKGEEISVDARIIALADTYDAITSYRTYHNIRSKDVAIEEIKRCLGTQFDPRLGNKFIELVSENADI